MFRAIRNKKNELSIEKATLLLKNERRAVLAVNGDGGYPYALPINFLYLEDEGKIVFHGSCAGHKIDSIKRDDRVCLTVYGNETASDEAWAPCLQSVIVFGRCKIVENRERTMELLRAFAAKYYPDAQLIEEEIARSGKAVRMLELTIEHMSGKLIQEK